MSPLDHTSAHGHGSAHRAEARAPSRSNALIGAAITFLQTAPAVCMGAYGMARAFPAAMACKSRELLRH